MVIINIRLKVWKLIITKYITGLKVWKLKYITVICYNHLHIVRGDWSVRAKFQNGCLAFRRCLWGSDKVIIHSPISIYSTFYKFCIFAFQLKKNPRENVNYLTRYSRLFNHYLEYQTNLRKSKTFCSKGFRQASVSSWCNLLAESKSASLAREPSAANSDSRVRERIKAHGSA